MTTASSEPQGPHKPQQAAGPTSPPPGTPGIAAAEGLTAPSGQPGAPPRTPATTPANSYLSADKRTAPYVAVPMTAPPMVAMFGRYQILEEFPGGGMGVVYRAHDTVLGRAVALKKIRTSRLDHVQIGERFYREAQAVAQLSHPNIIKIFDYGEIQGQHYFTMALVRNASLDRHVERIGADPRAAVRLLQKVALAVQHIHDQGLLHRDLKPANILVEENDEPIVSDFGLAKAPESDPGLTATGMAPGTPSYMAPEQAGGNNAGVCKQTDVWALGVILYEILTGKRPFTADGGGADRVKQSILDSEPPPPRSLKRRIDRDLETIILKCLEKHPARRYLSAGALADDLGCWLRKEPIRAKPTTRVRKMWRFLRRHPRWLMAAALLVAATAAAPLALEYADPEPVLNRIVYPELRRGEPVTLVGAMGGPLRSRWVLPGVEFSGGPNGNFALDTHFLSLLELLPHPGLDRYRFSVEVRHEKSSNENPSVTSLVGLYVTHARRPTSRGDLHGFTAITFADRGPTRKRVEADSGDELEAFRGQVWFRQVFTVQSGPSKVFYSAGVPTIERTTPGDVALRTIDSAEKTWRQLAVDVTPEAFRVYWGKDKELLGTVRLAHWRELADKLNENARVEIDASVQLPLHGGLGLVVYRGAASYRNAVIEPLPE